MFGASAFGSAGVSTALALIPCIFLLNAFASAIFSVVASVVCNAFINLVDNDFKSFPSGHTTAAFAAATVYAMEYRKSVVVPIVAYTAASLVGLSRISENKHWATDVLLGATLGYLCGRVVVNNYHRYAKLKKEQTKATNRKSISMTLNYNYGVLQPGVVYRF